MNTIRLLLFANLREKAGVSAEEIVLPDNAIIDDVLFQLKERYPQLKPHLTEKIIISINQKIALRSTIIPKGAEVALMPPVGGGKR